MKVKVVKYTLRDLRKMSGKSQDDIAKELGWGRGKVSRIEAGGFSGPISDLERYCEVAGLSGGYVMKKVGGGFLNVKVF